jgi:hypothetical protein
LELDVLGRLLGVLAAGQKAPAAPHDLGPDLPQQDVECRPVSGRRPQRELLGLRRLTHLALPSVPVRGQA